MALLGLRGKVAIVTGGARNIGRAIAMRLAVEGVRVTIADVRQVEAERLVKAIEKLGGQAFAVPTDLRDEAQVARMASQVGKTFGRIDILVNNAGWTESPSVPVESLTVDQWDKMQEISLRSAFLCTKAIVPWMRRRKQGRIINISSVVFWVGVANCTDYMAAKGGVLGLTRGLARELGLWNINVNAITPGAVRTPQERLVATASDVRRIVQAQCLRSRVVPEDIARAAVFLASDMSSCITGQTINVDAGWALH